MDRRQFIKATGVAGSVAFAGCSGDGDGNGNGNENGNGGGNGNGSVGGQETDSGGKSNVSTQIAFSFYPLPAHSVPLQVAREKGYFEERGVTIEEVVSFSGGGTTVRGVATGGIGTGNSGLPAAIQAFMSGAPIRLIGIVATKSIIDFQVEDDSDIETIQDVAGKTIAVSNPGSSSEAMAVRSIQNAEGISLDDVEIMTAGGLGEAVTATKEGEADVTWNFPPLSLKNLDSGDWRQVWTAKEMAPNVRANFMYMGDRFLEENTDAARGIVESYIQGNKFVKNNVNKAAEIFAANNDIEVDVAKRILEFAEPQEFNIKPREAIIKDTANTLLATGAIDQEPPWEEFFHQDILPEDKRADWV